MLVPKENARLVRRAPGDTFGPLRLTTESLGSFIAEVQNITVLGIGLIGATEYPLGTSFVIEAGPNGRNLPSALIAVLRHATLQPDGRWLLGCSFSRPLTAYDVDILG